MNNSNSTRLSTYTAVQTHSDSNLTVGWYRFFGATGTVLLLTFPNNPASVATNPGFIGVGVYTNLTIMGQSTTVLYRFNYYNVTSCDFVQNVTVTYYNNYYVFYIAPSSP